MSFTPTPVHPTFLRSNTESLWVTLAGALLLWTWVMAVGRDLSWDVINHHVYLPFSLLSGRYAADLFAAGPQSYQNPIGYIPFYGLVRSNLPSWMVGTALVTLHALVIWPLHRISLLIWGSQADSRWWRLMALALCLATPMLWLLAGTSSVDPLTSALLVAALWLVLSPGTGLGRAAWAGALVGLAFAIKPVNAVFVLALASVALARLFSGQWRLAQVLTLGAAAAIAAAITMGFWSAWLWSSFGNPLFPLFNHWFGSPFAPQEPVLSSRFMPTTALDWLTRPFEMASFQAYGSTEALVPDLRPALLALLLPAAAALALIKDGLKPWRAWAELAELQIALFLATSYVFWLATSGNARYALPALMLLGLLLARSAQALLPRSMARIALGLLLVGQIAYYGADGDRRVEAIPWDAKPFLQTSVPPKLVQTPYLHLSVGTQTLAAMAPYLHPDGALINLVGQMSMPSDGALGQALQQRLQAWKDRTRFLFQAAGDADGVPVLTAVVRKRLNRMVHRSGLSIDFADCEPMRIEREFGRGPQPLLMLSCAAFEGATPATASKLGAARQAFAMIESRCPRIFGPPPLATDDNGEFLQRLYVNSDARVTVSPEDGVLVSHFRSMKIIFLGSIDQVASGQGADPCLAWRELETQMGNR